MGPTASGKTSLSIDIAQKYNGEIISADSRQLYFGMNIGTAKTVKRNRVAKSFLDPVFYHDIPHYLIDTLLPNEPYSAANFGKEASKIIKDIHNRNKLPIVVGGTGFYVRSLTGEMSIPHVEPDPKFRDWAEKQSLQSLFEELTKTAPDTAKRIDSNNPRRVIRALEIAKSGIDSEKTSTRNDWNILKLGINKSIDELRILIAKRANEMLESGLVKETEQLLKKYGPLAPGLQTIGYREVIPYLNGETSLEKTHQDIISATIHYAKRQITWLKKEPNFNWVNNKEEAFKKINGWLKE